MKEDWLQDIRDRMAGYETDEPDGLWEAIEKRQTEAYAEAGRARGRAISLWVKRSMTAAALLAIVASVCLFFSESIPEVPEFADLQESRGVTPAGSGHMVARAGTAVPESPVTAGSESMPEAPEPVIAPDVTDVAIQEELQAAPPPCPPHSSDSLPEQAARQSLVVVPPESRRASRVNVDMASAGHRTDNRGPFSFSVFGSGGTGSMMTRRYPGVVMAESLGADGSGWADKPMLGILVFNQGLETEIDISHRLPVRAGVSFAYDINRRWSLESGLSYTCLASDIREGSDIHYYTGEQKLHYIGIPLNMKYRALTWRRLSLYASAGLLAEKCVSARIRKEYVLHSRRGGTETAGLPEKPMQWSVNAAIGLECGIVGNLGLFAEPGISYYFDDGTDISTIYKEKPLNFNLSLGLRFTFGQ